MTRYSWIAARRQCRKFHRQRWQAVGRVVTYRGLVFLSSVEQMVIIVVVADVAGCIRSKAAVPMRPLSPEPWSMMIIGYFTEWSHL